MNSTGAKRYLGKILDVAVGTDDTAEKNTQSSVDTFYSSNKPEKEICEPQNFVATQFSLHFAKPVFSIVKRIVRKDRVGDIVSTLEASGLRGCGGAHFPVAVKWKAALEHPDPRYLIINGQEGEPYTFKDYMIMKYFPHIVVEGVVLAALALGVNEVIIAINSGYEECIKNITGALQDVVSEMPKLDDITFRVVSGPKPDLYICGEETALIEFLENRRGEPQLKPPYPFQSGYKGQPTIIQNVETIAWIPLLMENPELFQEQGLLKLVHIFGAVDNPGIYEVRIGSTLNGLLRVAGGLSSGSCLQAIEVGGVVGGLLPPHYLSLALEHKEMALHGAMLGTGSVNFLDLDINLIEMALQAMESFRNESCGRCTPCRVGTYELSRIARIMIKRALTESEKEWFKDIAHTMVNTSSCGLGKSAPSVLVSLLRYWNVENGAATLKDDCAVKV